MYCKYCGKHIEDDSSFCQYCGGKLRNESLSQESNIIQLANNEDNLVENTSEVIIVTKEANQIQVEVSPKSKDNSSTIANEIIGNLKMIGIAAVLFVIYMIGFMIIHQKDISQYDYGTHTSYLGESCYDPTTLTGNWKFHWEEHYYENLYFWLYNEIPFQLQASSREQCLKNAEYLEEEINKRKAALAGKRRKQPYIKGADGKLYEIGDPVLESINFERERERAKAEAIKDIQDWNNTINSRRRWGYEEDLKKNAIYSAIINLLVMILGRYLVKAIKWINENKTT